MPHDVPPAVVWNRLLVRDVHNSLKYLLLAFVEGVEGERGARADDEEEEE